MSAVEYKTLALRSIDDDAHVQKMINAQETFFDDSAVFSYAEVVKKRNQIEEDVDVAWRRLKKIQRYYPLFKILPENIRMQYMKETQAALYVFLQQEFIQKSEKRSTKLSEKGKKYCTDLLGFFEAQSWDQALPEEPKLNVPVSTIDWITYVNGFRLFDVWTTASINSIFTALEEDEARARLQLQAPFTRALSFLLYYARLGITLYDIMQHSLPAFCLAEDDPEALIPWHERLMMHVHQHKDLLINDALWGTANLLGLIVLCGSGWPGYESNILNFLLFLMDVGMAVWTFSSARKNHKDRLENYKNNITELETKDPKDQDMIDLLKGEWAQEETAWIYKEKRLKNDILYVGGLAMSFFLLCSALFPPLYLLPATIVMFSLVGSSGCLGFTLFHKFWDGYLHLEERHALMEHEKNVTASAIAQLKLLLEQKQAPEDWALKKLYIDIKTEENMANAKKKALDQKQTMFYMQTAVNVAMPVLIFTVLLMLPTGGAAAALIPLFLLTAMLLHSMNVAEEMPEVFEFEEGVYLAYIEDQQNSLISNTKSLPHDN